MKKCTTVRLFIDHQCRNILLFILIKHFQVKCSWNKIYILSRTVSPLTIARASTILFLIELFPSSITNTETALVEFVSFVGRALFFFMASATFHSCSFSGLLHDTTPCGLSSDYPGQVKVLALRNCTRDISRHCELVWIKSRYSTWHWMETAVSKSRGICSGRVPLVIDNMPSPQSGIWYALEILKSEV